MTPCGSYTAYLFSAMDVILGEC